MAIGPGGPVGPFRSALEARAFARILAKDTAIGLAGAEVVIAELESIGSGRGLTFVPVQRAVLDPILGVIGELESAVGQPLFDAIFGAALGSDVLTAMEDKAPDAIRTLRRVIGFTVGLPFGTERLHGALKALLGEHAPDSLLKAIEKLPAELGMNFFIPEVLSTIVRSATETPLQEAIAEVRRPFRLEWPQLRALARVHAFDDAELRARLAKIGVRDQDMDLLTKIDQQLLPVGDLQAMYLAGLMDEATVADRLGQLGFSPADTSLVIQLYLQKSETAGGDMLRSVARQGFLDDHLSEGQYRAILEQVNVPQRSLELEVQAGQLQKSWTEHQLTVGEIKALTQDGSLSETEAKQRLEQAGYAPVDAGAIVLSWRKAAKAAHAGFTRAMVLAYLAHGVLTPAQAYDHLIALNIRAEDARFLVDHPTLTAPVAIKPVTATAIVAAYVDDVIDRTQAEQLMLEIPTDETQIRLLLAVADDRKAKGPKPKVLHKALSESQVIEAFKLGLAADSWAVRELVTLGYAEQDAQLLVVMEETKLAGALPGQWTTLY